AASRYYGTRAILVFLVLTGLGWGVWEANGHIHGRHLVRRVLEAEPREVQQVIYGDLPGYHRWADPHLRAALESGHAHRQLRASLALLPVDDTLVEYLSRRLLDCSVEEFPVVRDSLREHRGKFQAFLWQTLRERHGAPLAGF